MVSIVDLKFINKAYTTAVNKYVQKIRKNDNTVSLYQ